MNAQSRQPRQPRDAKHGRRAGDGVREGGEREEEGVMSWRRDKSWAALHCRGRWLGKSPPVNPGNRRDGASTDIAHYPGRNSHPRACNVILESMSFPVFV